jgi:cyanophycinase
MSQISLEVNLPGPGTLALTGSGEYLPGMQEVDRWLTQQLVESARVVTLATAAGTEGTDRLRYWDELGIQHFTNLGVERVQALPVIDRRSAEDNRLADVIRQANFVYLSGGKPGYLYQTLMDTPVWAAICGVLQAGGVVAGCSAGAMIFGEQIPGIRIIGQMGPGFGFLPGAYIVPHFDEIPEMIRQGLRLLHQRTRMIGIEGFTSLVCTSKGCQVRGRGQVRISNGDTFLHYRQEDSF